ncbi:MAG: hypothetical protein HY648_00850 [Acidobacteria bacterium]|nr:hypothetical protein [Acidobacteriota bacterium]
MPLKKKSNRSGSGIQRKSAQHLVKPASADGTEEGGRKTAEHEETETAVRQPADLVEAVEPVPATAFPIVGIGASAGGLEAFLSLLKALPPTTGMAFVFVQHMDPSHESMLNRLLARETSMPVTEVTQGVKVEPNRAYVIPPNREMTIRKGVLRLGARPSGAGHRTPIDSFLCALAEDQGSKAIGVIFSGIGSDGTNGLQAIKAAGGITFVQDEESAKYSGMPNHAVAAGCVDFVLPPDQVAKELSRIGAHPYLELAPSPAAPPPAPAAEDTDLRKIFRDLKAHTGVDFTNYKMTTIRRRIARRMLVKQIDTVTEYAKYVSEHPEEARALFQDMLIHVTEFFREPEVFETLEKFIFPRIIANLPSGEAVRIWVPGCSTGEEVYSLAIALQDQLGDTPAQSRIQIFGTDISERDIQKARAATYPPASVQGISAERLRRFFVKAEEGFQIAKPIRDLCIFARQDLTRDPPFSRMDLISCRNVLIYMAAPLQKKILSVFHYALRPGGYLLLGKAESITSASNLFTVDHPKANVYSRRDDMRRRVP